MLDSTQRCEVVRILSGIVVLVLVVVLPFGVDADGPAGNLTRYWGLEGWGAAYGDYNGHMLQVAEGWTRFNTYGEEARFMNDQEYAGLFRGSGAIERHCEGDYAQTLWLGHPFVAGIYQQIQVTPGVPYAAKAWPFIAIGSTVSNPDNKILVQIGIDPYGGTDANSPRIIWGNPDGRQKAWPHCNLGVRTAAYAVSPTITLFVRVVNMQGEVKPDWNAVWLDSIVLFQAPSASASSPERTDSLSFTVSAVNAQAAPDGTLTGDYDFQVKDGIDGRWRTWRSKKSGGPHDFVGELGHTYYFRARAWQSYGGIDLYGAHNPSPEGDTHTIVGG
jgi:hypothetical protein